MGVNITKYKVRAFVFSAFFAGLAGALYALKVGTINAGELAFQKSFDIVIMVVLGGLGSVFRRGTGRGDPHAAFQSYYAIRRACGHGDLWRRCHCGCIHRLVRAASGTPAHPDRSLRRLAN